VLRFLILIAIAVGLTVCGATVKLGNRTFFGHVRAIWATDEAKDLAKGIGDKAGPVVDKVKRGAKAGWNEATKDDKAGSGSAEKPEAPPRPFYSHSHSHSHSILFPFPLPQLELFAERRFGRQLAVGIGRIERPPALTFVGPVVRARVATPEEAVATRGAQLEPARFVEQLLGERKLHRLTSRASLCPCACRNRSRSRSRPCPCSSSRRHL
jgi:hypothetical protein